MSFNAGFGENPFGASLAAQALQQGVKNGAPPYQSSSDSEMDLPPVVSHYSSPEEVEIPSEYEANPFLEVTYEIDPPTASRMEIAKNKVSEIWNNVKAGFKAFGQKASNLFGRIKSSIANNKGKAAAISIALMVAGGIMSFFPPTMIPGIALSVSGCLIFGAVQVIKTTEKVHEL